MNSLKKRISKLESNIIKDRECFLEQTTILYQEISGIKEEVYVASILFAGISFGFATGIGKGSIIKRLTRSAMLLLNVANVTKRFIV